LSRKTRVLDAAKSKDIVILGCTVLIQIQSVTDGQVDRWTPRRRATHYMMSRVRIKIVFQYWSCHEPAKSLSTSSTCHCMHAWTSPWQIYSYINSWQNWT